MVVFRACLQDFVTELQRGISVKHGFDPITELREFRDRLRVEDGENLLEIAALHSRLQRLENIASHRLLKVQRLRGTLSRGLSGIVGRGSIGLLRPAWRCYQRET